MEKLMRSFRGSRHAVQPAGPGRDKEAPPTMRRSDYSLVSVSDVTSGVLSVFSGLPELVRNDPSLADFKEKYDKHNGADERHPKTVTVAPGPPDEDDPSPSPSQAGSRTRLQKGLHYLKISTLLCVWLGFTAAFMMYGEKQHSYRLSYVNPDLVKDFPINETWKNPSITLLIDLMGPFLTEQEEQVQTVTTGEAKMEVWLETGGSDRKKSNSWFIVLHPADEIDFVEPEKRSQRLHVDLPTNDPQTALSIRVRANSSVIVPISVTYYVNPIDEYTGVICSLLLLLGLYTLIIFEIINRTLAAVVASSSALAVLAAVGERPQLLELVSWLDVETLLLLFSMMLLVAITAETGLFDFLAVFTFSVTKGRMWPLINLLCFFTAILSTFLDNVTTVLLMTPVTIKLCELMELNPVPILMAMVIYSNIGGTATPVGDPPNVIIASNHEVIQSGIHFANFTLHMTIGILLVSFTTYIQLRFIYRKTSKLRLQYPKDIQELKQQISVWHRAAAGIGALSRDEQVVKHALTKKVGKLESRLSELMLERKKRAVSEEKFHNMLSTLRNKYKIRDKVLLYKSAFAITFVVLAFFLHAIPELRRISLGWTALLGAILLLILADREDIENVLARVEWSTLLFFAALFVLMEALAKLGLIHWIGGLTERLILQVNESSRLAVAILLILWVSGLASAFVDNIPLTTMMIRVATSLGNNPTLGLPMAPLIWAMSFGACLGGNGTLIGASANVVTAGVAEQHGYRFTFMEFFKVGFPVMLGQLATATCYLLVCHCLFTWH